MHGKVERLHAKFHLNVFMVSASGGQKTQFWANFNIFFRGPVPTPFTYDGQIWCLVADPRHTLTCQISCRSVYPVAFWRPKTHFLPYFRLRHLVCRQLAAI